MQVDLKANVARRFARNTGALAVGGVFAQASVIAVEVLMARGLGAESYGIFATTHAFVILSILIFDLGTNAWTIQEGSRDLSKLPELFGNSMLLKVAFFLVLYAGGAIAVQFFNLPVDTVAFIAIFAFYGLGLALVDSLAALYTAQQEMHINALFQALAPLAILVVYLFVSADGLSLIDAAVSYVVGSFLIGGTWLFWTLRNRLVPHAKLLDAITLASKSYHYCFSGVLRQIYYKTDIVMVAFMVGAAEAGIFAAAVKFLDFFYKIPLLLSRVVSPTLFAESASDISNDRFEALVSTYSRYLVVLGAVAALVTYLSAKDLVLVAFGPAYESSAAILQILSAVMILKCMMIVGESVLSSLGAHTARWGSLAVTVIVNIVLNILLIPLMGAAGAAMATVISGILLVFQFILFGFGRARILKALLWFGIPSILTVCIALAFRSLEAPAFVVSSIALSLLIAALIVMRVISIAELKGFFQSLKNEPNVKRE